MSYPPLLRVAFLTGAIADAAAVVPLAYTPAARFLLGWTDIPPTASLALGYAATLMAGWTGLLLWASRRPAERSFVGWLTMGVIGGLVLAEAVAVHQGAVRTDRMLPIWVAQALLLALFGVAHGARPRSGAGPA